MTSTDRNHDPANGHDAAAARRFAPLADDPAARARLADTIVLIPAAGRVAEAGADFRQCCGIHSSRMLVDETVLPRGTAFLAGCATLFLERGWDRAQ